MQLTSENIERRHSKRTRDENGEVRVSKVMGSSNGSRSDDQSQQPQTESIDDVAITELLERDCRPTFVVDLKRSDSVNRDAMNIVFCNQSMRFFDEMRSVIPANTFYPSPALSSSALHVLPGSQESTEISDSEFREWAMYHGEATLGSMDGYLPRFTFREMFWTATTLRDRWRVISATKVPKQRPRGLGTPRSSRSASASSTSQTPLESLTPSPLTPSPLTDSDALTRPVDLSAQLAETQSRFKVLTELSPVGMYYLNPAGDILYCNDMWYSITGHPRGLEGEMSFMNVICESDHPTINERWLKLITEKGKQVFELKLRDPSQSRNGEPRQKYILASCDQEFDEDGRLKSIMGCITDISEQKENEENAKQAAKLVEDVAKQTQLAAQHAQNFAQMAELTPCGMFTFDPDGMMTWANSQWYEMTGQPRKESDPEPLSFLNAIEQKDHQIFHDEWKRLTVDKIEINAELRVKKTWIRDDAESWILLLASPQLDEQGELLKIFGCTTDISHFKWSESVEKRNRQKAEEAKRNQEMFIDMTSHEMRNPLSALLLSADGIVNSINDFNSKYNSTDLLWSELMANNLDAAQTIVLCAQHQTRIIDDVLTLSKLESAMLHVTPVQVHVESTVLRTLKIFQSELEANEIQLTFKVEPSYKDAHIDKVFCDPVRLTQIFINLLTNAIKFTRSENHRHISISMSACLSKPPNTAAPDIQWFPSKDSNEMTDLTLKPEWGTGEHIYLYFAVRDTGRGLTDDEKNLLFHRFSQASPRTHVQYGGSGLGLFISRRLTELQGGEIGVASMAGAGSTFAFYIKARRPSSLSSMLTSPLHSRTFPDRLESHHNGATPNSSHPTTPERIRHNYHLLLVEDNLINQKVLSKQLRGIGCTVHVANHGSEALDFLSKTTRSTEPIRNSTDQRMEIALILMDLEMPIMDGLTCARSIRDREREGTLKGHLPIIAVTANARVEQMAIALEAGMDDIVTKPFQIPELMQKIDLLMGLEVM